MKKVVILVVSIVIVLGVSITAFAVNEAAVSNYDVTFNFYQKDSTVTPATQSEITDSITVSVEEDLTVKDALDAALAQESTTGHVYYATWTGSGPYFLYAVKLDGTNYVNDCTIIGTTYTGASWMWDYDLMGSYPSDYLDEATITNNTTIYLIYENSSYSY